MVWWMCPFSTVTEPNFLSSASACAASSVPQPHSGYTLQSGMCANTTIGVLCLRWLMSSCSQASCSAPSVPRPPALRFSTFTRAMKWTPFVSKLYHPAPLALLPYRSRYSFPSSSSTSCSPGTKNTPFGRALCRIWSTASNSSGFDRWLMSPVCSMNSGTEGSALIRSTAACSVPTTSGFAALLNPMWLSLICTKRSVPADASGSFGVLRLYDFRTPPSMMKNAPVPAHAMHVRKPRRSIPSSCSWLDIPILLAGDYAGRDAGAQWPTGGTCLPVQLTAATRVSSPCGTIRRSGPTPVMQQQEARRVSFGVFELDLLTGELRKHGLRMRLQRQPFDVLVLLIERAGDVVTREELQQKLWPANTFVDFDHGLNKAINKIRETLGDSAEAPRFVETVARRGYRFLADVRTIAPPPVASAVTVADVPAPPPAVGVRRRSLNWMAAAVVAILASAGVTWELYAARHGAPALRSLAVLPLESLSSDPSQDYFADGMTDELITELGRIGALRVISRTSVMAYKHTRKPLPEI